MVAGKVPLPNYRPDLDDKRPQREVILVPLRFFFSYLWVLVPLSDDMNIDR